MRGWFAYAGLISKKFPPPRRVLARFVPFWWRPWSWSQSEPTRAGLVNSLAMVVGLLSAAWMPKGSCAGVWLFSCALGVAVYRLAALQFWPRHAQSRAFRQQSMAAPLAVVIGILGLSWVPRELVWIVCVALALAAMLVAVRVLRCVRLDRVRMGQRAWRHLHRRISMIKYAAPGEASDETEYERSMDHQHAWSIAGRLASCHGRYEDALPPEVGSLIAEAADLFPEMVRSTPSQ